MSADASPRRGEEVLSAASGRCAASTSTVADDEIFALLGPTGAGKSSTLLASAGLIDLDAGRVHLDGRDVTDADPASRDVAIVFEGFNLLPVLDVKDNIAFALRSPAYREPETEIAARVGAHGGAAAHRPSARPRRRHAVGRRAPARRHRPRAGAPAAALPARRAALGARPQAARGPAGGTAPDPSPASLDDALRDARLSRRHRDRRPDRHHRRRRPAAGRHDRRDHRACRRTSSSAGSSAARPWPSSTARHLRRRMSPSKGGRQRLPLAGFGKVVVRGRTGCCSASGRRTSSSSQPIPPGAIPGTRLRPRQSRVRTRGRRSIHRRAPLPQGRAACDRRCSRAMPAASALPADRRLSSTRPRVARISQQQGRAHDAAATQMAYRIAIGLILGGFAILCQPFAMRSSSRFPDPACGRRAVHRARPRAGTGGRLRRKERHD